MSKGKKYLSINGYQPIDCYDSYKLIKVVLQFWFNKGVIETALFRRWKDEVFITLDEKRGGLK